MATFYYNRGKREDIVTQWIDHLQHDAYVKDEKQLIEKNHKEISELIKTGSVEQVKAINNVCGQLNDMNLHIQSINCNISKLSGEINAMASLIDWKLSQMIEEQRITNQLLGFVATLLRIPDSQKQRVYHIEQGIKYLKNAFMENDVNSSFYIDAFEELKKAEYIERKDFITLNRIGQIHLYSKSHLDFEKAEEYFLKSARESYAEANVNGTTVPNNLSPYGYELYIYSKNPFLAATAESYLYAGRACYLQRKLDKAIEYAQKAFELVPEFLLAGFEQAKYLAANNKEIESISLLNKVITTDRFFLIKTVKDKDLIFNKVITDFLEGLKFESYRKAQEKYEDLKKNAGTNSRANQIISEINNHLSKNNYLSNLKALDMIDKKYELPIYENNHTEMRYEGMIITRRLINQVLNLSEFLQKENNSQKEFLLLLDSLKQKLIRAKTLNYGLFGAGIGTILSIFQGHAGMVVYWLFETLIFAILGAVLGYLIANSTSIKVVER